MSCSVDRNFGNQSTDTFFSVERLEKYKKKGKFRRRARQLDAGEEHLRSPTGNDLAQPYCKSILAYRGGTNGKREKKKKKKEERIVVLAECLGSRYQATTPSSSSTPLPSPAKSISAPCRSPELDSIGQLDRSSDGVGSRERTQSLVVVDWMRAIAVFQLKTFLATWR